METSGVFVRWCGSIGANDALKFEIYILTYLHKMSTKMYVCHTCQMPFSWGIWWCHLFLFATFGTCPNMRFNYKHYPLACKYVHTHVYIQWAVYSKTKRRIRQSFLYQADSFNNSSTWCVLGTSYIPFFPRTKLFWICWTTTNGWRK